MRTSISVVLSALLVLSGCGGGAGGDAASSNTQDGADTIFVSPSSDYAQNSLKVDEYHKQLSQSLEESSQLVLKSNGIVDLAYKMQNTQLSDADFLSLAKSYDDSMMALFSHSNVLLINSINLDTLQSETEYAQSRSFTPDTRALFTTAVGLGLLAYSAYNMYKKTSDAITKNAKNNINNLAISSKGRSAVVQMFKDRGIEISDDASLPQINEKIKSISVNQLTSISRESLEYSRANSIDQSEVLESARTKMVETAVTIGEVAVESTVTGATGATGSATVSFTDPLSLVNKHVSTSAVSKKKLEVPTEPTTMQIDKAKEIVEKISKEGAGEISVSELEDSTNAIINDIAKRDGDGNDDIISIPEYATSQSYVVVETKKEDEAEPNKASGKLKIYDEYQFDRFDVLITNGEEIDHIFEDVTPYFDDNLLIELEPKALERSTELSFVKLSETADSVTYRVSAKITGVSDTITVVATPTNASIATPSQKLSSDGVLSWNVIVLDKDATIAVSRSDSSEIPTIVLKGKANTPAFVEIFEGVLTSARDDAEDSFICFYDVGDNWAWLVNQNGDLYDYEGEAAYGKITGESLQLTFLNTEYSGTIHSGQWSSINGGCSGTYSGSYYSLSELRSLRDECAASEECKILQEIDDIIAYKEAL